MNQKLNLCMATLPNFDLQQGLKLAKESGYDGVELRIHDAYHVSLQALFHQHRTIRRMVESYELSLEVYNTYHGLNDDSAIETLINICRRTGVKYFRVVLPVAGDADVSLQAKEGAIIPSYKSYSSPKDILKLVRKKLLMLERKCKLAGVTALLEIHWGTIMSSFSSAYFLLSDLDPKAISITFDPANMVIEGKEDWRYGIHLLKDHLRNVHVKNASWEQQGGSWKWRWDDLKNGMVNWNELFGLLNQIGYMGMVAMEDFRVPTHYSTALEHLRSHRIELQGYQCVDEAVKVS